MTAADLIATCRSALMGAVLLTTTVVSWHGPAARAADSALCQAEREAFSQLEDLASGEVAQALHLEAYRDTQKSDAELLRYLRCYASDEKSLKWFEREVLPRSREVERQFKIPAPFFACLLARESAIGRLRRATSPRDAKGVAQITPIAALDYSRSILRATIEPLALNETEANPLKRQLSYSLQHPFEAALEPEARDPRLRDYTALSASQVEHLRDRVRTRLAGYAAARPKDCPPRSSCAIRSPAEPTTVDLFDPARALPIAASILSHHLLRVQAFGVETRKRDLTPSSHDALMLVAAAYNAGFSAAASALQIPSLRLPGGRMILQREKLPEETRRYLTAIENCMTPGNFQPMPGTETRACTSAPEGPKK